MVDHRPATSSFYPSEALVLILFRWLCKACFVSACVSELSRYLRCGFMQQFTSRFIWMPWSGDQHTDAPALPKIMPPAVDAWRARHADRTEKADHLQFFAVELALGLHSFLYVCRPMQDLRESAEESRAEPLETAICGFGVSPQCSQPEQRCRLQVAAASEPSAGKATEKNRGSMPTP